jgi:hypothetical protein
MCPSRPLGPEGGVFERRLRAGGDRSRFGEADRDGVLGGSMSAKAVALNE